MTKWLDHQLKKTKKTVNRNVSREDLITLTVLIFIIDTWQVSDMGLNMYIWAQNPSVAFDSYHLYAPIVALAGWVGYSIVLVWRNVQIVSVLPFLPAAIGLFYNAVLSLIRFGFIGPEILKIW